MRLGLRGSSLRRGRVIRRGNRLLAHPRHRRCRRRTVVGAETLFRIAASLGHRTRLFRRCRIVARAHRALLLGSRLAVHAARPVEARAIVNHGRVVDDRSVRVHVANDRGVHIHHRGVVLEHITCPAPDASRRPGRPRPAREIRPFLALCKAHQQRPHENGACRTFRQPRPVVPSSGGVLQVLRVDRSILATGIRRSCAGCRSEDSRYIPNSIRIP